MKKLIISVLLISAFLSCNNETNVGSTIDNRILAKEYVDIEIMNEDLKNNGFVLQNENQISQRLQTTFENLNSQVSSFKLIKEIKGYSIMAINADGDIKSSILLESGYEKGSNTLKTGTGGSSDCTCTGCTDGCSPRRHESGDCWCTACVPSSGAFCEKTETVTK